MSTINNKVLLHELNIPALNSVGYADGLDNALIAIDNNISLLANSDFLKGSQGDSVNIEKIDLRKQPVLFNKLKQAILNGATPRQINGVNWDAYLSTELYVINSVVSNGVESVSTPIASLYYTFVDARYVNKFVGTVTDFGNERDLSCILTYDGTKFNRINAFPTMYYEKGVGLCWMVNGQKTGLPVQGIPGNDGKNSDILIVRVDGNPDTDGKGRVDKVWTKGGGWEYINDPSDYDGYSCFALAPKYKTDDNGQPIVGSNGHYQMDSATSFYIGKLISQNGSLYVVCKPELSLQQTFGAAVFIEAMQNISLLQNSDTIVTPKGIFVPMKTLGDLKVGEPQPIHIITATSINNEQGNYEETMTDMIITPVNTTDIVIDRDRNLKVDKYLYVKLSDEVKAAVGVSGTVICKYKLENIVLTENIVKPYTENDDCFLLKDGAYSNGELDYDKVISIINYNKLIPDDYRQRIRNGYGIYQWGLVQGGDEFDPANTYTGGNTKIGLYLNNIYTKSMTPGLGDEILWFNSLIVDNGDLEGDYDHDFEPDYDIGGTAAAMGVWEDEWESPSHIGAWEDDWNTTISENVILYRGVDFKSLKFEKFVPIYENQYNVKRDTALNINYNVNITGDEDNPKKNLSVHGDVNCDNLNVYELTATKEIKNIKTNDEIYGKGGIRLADDKFVVNKDADVLIDGQLDVNDSIIVDDVYSRGNITADDIKFIKKTINGSDKYLIKSSDVVIDMNSSFYQESGGRVNDIVHDVMGTNTNIDIDRVRNINIRRGADIYYNYNYYDNNTIYWDTYNFPVIESNVAGVTDDATMTVSVNKPKTLIYKHPHGYKNGTTSHNWFYSASKANTYYTSGSSRVYNTYNDEFSFPRGKQGTIHQLYEFSSSSDTFVKELSATSAYSPDMSPGSCSHQIGYYAHKLTIPKSNRYDNIRDITISFPDKLNFVVTTSSRYHKGSWPKMKDTSFIQLDVFAMVGGTVYKVDVDEVKQYPLPKTDINWYGAEHFDNEEYNFGVMDRSYCLSIRPDNITISVEYGNNDFLKTSEDIVLYVIPTGKIEFYSEENTIKHIGLTTLRPDNGVDSDTNISKYLNSISGNISGIKAYVYSYKNIPTETMKSTTICPDGVSIHSGDMVFGIGCDNTNEPVLLINKDGGSTLESIPIKGLAEMYKWYKESH